VSVYIASEIVDDLDKIQREIGFNRSLLVELALKQGLGATKRRLSGFRNSPTINQDEQSRVAST